MRFRLPKVAVVALFLVIVLMLIGVWVPMIGTTEYRCPWCGAYESRSKLLRVIPVRKNQREGPLAKYWCRNVEPTHKHEWIRLEGFEYNILYGRHFTAVGWNLPRWRLRDDSIIAVLQDLPSAKERKQFMEAIWRGGRDVSTKNYSEIKNTVYEVKIAYNENPARKDWMLILKRLRVFDYKAPPSNSTGKEGAKS